MAFFNFRFPGRSAEGRAQGVPPAESVEALRRRARHRLIGAAVLVLLGVVGFPLLFDTQPRPVAVDIPIEIPDKARAKPLVMPAPAASQPVAAAPVNTAQSGGVVEAPAPAAPVATVPKPETKPAPAAAPAAPAPAPKPPADDGNRARALLEGQAAAATTAPAAATAATGRFVVQVGAFADIAKAREVRAKLERAGLKTYTHVADTPEGKRTRVRIGPFDTRAEADKAAAKVKGLDLPAAILTL